MSPPLCQYRHQISDLPSHIWIFPSPKSDHSLGCIANPFSRPPRKKPGVSFSPPLLLIWSTKPLPNRPGIGCVISNILIITNNHLTDSKIQYYFLLLFLHKYFFTSFQHFRMCVYRFQILMYQIKKLQPVAFFNGSIWYCKRKTQTERDV